MTSHPPPVYPLTTLLYEPTGGFHLLERHYARVNSAAKDLFPGRDTFPNFKEFTKAIWECVNILGASTRQRVRVVLEDDNQYHVTATPLPKTESRPLSLRLDTVSTPANFLAAHKTTAREIYESARARANADYGSNSPLCDRPFDVLMWNSSGDITETSIANFAVYLRGPELLAAMPDWNRSSQELARGVYVTPCLSKGLIAGVMRAELLEHGTVVEGTITKEDIIRYAKSPESYPTICFNAVRGLYPVYFMDVLPEPQRAQVGGLEETKDCYPALSKPNPPALTPPLDLQVPGPPTDATTPGTTPALTPISSRSSAGTSSPNQARSEVDAALDSVPVVNHVLPKAFPWRRGVVIDCYDSYTNNLLQLFEHDAHSAGFDATLAAHVAVLRVDQISWPEFRSKILPHLDWVILSPGPGSPHVPEDIGVAGDLLKAVTSGEIEPIPIFGVCLGHQAMAAILGGKVIGSGELVHGRAVPISHDGTGIFEGIDTSAVLQMVRYNSLTVDHTAIPAELKVTATNPEDGEVMGLQHKTLPLYGVQFHPESIHSRRCNYGVDAGKQLVCNFMNIVEDFWATNGRPERSPLPLDIQELGVLNTAESSLDEQQASKTDRAPIYSVAKHDIGSLIPSFARDRLDLVFEATSYSPNAPFFWLDSASAAPGDNFARFSYMGPSSFDRCISYDLRTDQVTYGSDKHIQLEQGDTFWHWMDRVQSDLANLVQQEEGSEGLQCGFVGYFGYEMKAGSLPGYDRASLDHSSGPQTPDAQFMFADRLIAYDHWNKTCVALGLVRNETKSDDKSLLERETGLQVGMSGSEFADWIGDLERKLSNLKDSAEPESEIDPLPVTFAPNCTSEAYKAGIQKCKNHIADGNSYELCLTGTFTASSREHNLDYWAVYKHLRAHNPATHASFISFPATQTTIMSCSPELFIRFDGANGRHAAMKPIKGTLKRSKCQCGGLCKLPACGSRKVECDAARYKLDEERVQAFINNPKEMAENLMIADLIRANLLEFCGTSSVDCPILFGLETYENVYSLVSTITGELFPSVGTVEGVRRCFPPGSMTGAPKLRSVQLLDGLEAFTRRGIYSGCLGFLSLNNQAVFNVVIRTLVAHKDELSYGAGGAITWLSDAQGEWDEVVLKARSALKDRVPQSS